MHANDTLERSCVGRVFSKNKVTMYWEVLCPVMQAELTEALAFQSDQETAGFVLHLQHDVELGFKLAVVTTLEADICSLVYHADTVSIVTGKVRHRQASQYYGGASSFVQA